MILDRPAIDWLTLTTFDRKTAIELDAIVFHAAGEGAQSEPTRMDNYDGRWGDGFFCGEGIQGVNKYAHWMFNLWGDMADRVMFNSDLISLADVDCTRIDIQITLEWLFGNAFPAFYESIPIIEAGESEKGQRKRSVEPIVPPSGWCTMYVGSKTSDRRYRIYMKGEEDDLLIRFEVMYRGKKSYAGKAYKAILSSPDDTTRVIAEEIFSLPPESPIVKPFHDFVRTITGKPLPKGRSRPSPNKTLNWITRQVLPAFKRVLGNEDTRFTASMLLLDLVDFRENLGHE
ncbi:MAG: hypothetical protein H6658_20655 [Ardenticatenaceae bacterium]|nr:hypothetical protein [Ardenticatenaceae bacterium]